MSNAHCASLKKKRDKRTGVGRLPSEGEHARYAPSGRQLPPGQFQYLNISGRCLFKGVGNYLARTCLSLYTRRCSEFALLNAVYGAHKNKRIVSCFGLASSWKCTHTHTRVYSRLFGDLHNSAKWKHKRFC